ncbi:MAG TPA: hypothetical protein VF423_03275 [Actinomycetes bacterium]
MMIDSSTERAIWDEHYGALAGWVVALTGSREDSRAIADAAFVQIFASHRASTRHTRRRLHAHALSLVERRQRTAGLPLQLGAGSTLAEGLVRSPRWARRAELLRFAGLDDRDIAAVVHRSRLTVSRVLAEGRTAQVSPASRRRSFAR